MVFPHPSTAECDGLLAWGGDLSFDTLRTAYQFGIFPWYNQTPILWWHPDPRCVLFTGALKVSKSMRPYLNRPVFQLTTNTVFTTVMENCASVKRNNQSGTWINPQLIEAYHELHHKGYAHSVEVWQNGNLVGGLYGVAIGKVFFGESMFSKVSNASKYGFICLVRYLAQENFLCIDCQQETPHLKRLGATTIPRDDFMELLRKNWQFDDYCLKLPANLNSYKNKVVSGKSSAINA